MLFWFKRRKAEPHAAAPQPFDSTLAQALRDEGAHTERERIRGIVEAQLIEGHEELVGSLLFDGRSTAQTVALAVVQAERQRLNILAAAQLHRRSGLSLH